MVAIAKKYFYFLVYVLVVCWI